jgi:hypothetical protein
LEQWHGDISVVGGHTESFIDETERTGPITISKRKYTDISLILLVQNNFLSFSSLLSLIFVKKMLEILGAYIPNMDR